MAIGHKTIGESSLKGLAQIAFSAKHDRVNVNPAVFPYNVIKADWRIVNSYPVHLGMRHAAGFDDILYGRGFIQMTGQFPALAGAPQKVIQVTMEPQPYLD